MSSAGKPPASSLPRPYNSARPTPGFHLSALPRSYGGAARSPEASQDFLGPWVGVGLSLG